MTTNAAARQQAFQTMWAALRPPRAVVVYDGGDSWISNAALAMHACQGIWGGSGFLLLPHKYEAINPGGLQLRGADGKFLEGAERTAALEDSHDQTVRDLTVDKARRLIADDCTPLRYWIPGNNGERGSHHEQAHHLEAREHGPFTSIEEIGALEPSDAGVPSNLTGPWALAAAMHATGSVLPSWSRLLKTWPPGGGRERERHFETRGSRSARDRDPFWAIPTGHTAVWQGVGPARAIATAKARCASTASSVRAAAAVTW
jgi:hypothetical protein